MRFGLPILGLLALAAIPVIVFYFLKLRRPRVVIPSLVLWRQVMNDQRVNSPFQKFKRNILLWLQLLLLALVVLAAMQPFWASRAAPRNRLPILIDLSASMGALDKPGGRTRLDEAKERVRARISGLRRGQQAALLVFGRSAREAMGFTNNPRLLLEALDALRVEDTPGDPEDGLRMAAALHRRDGFERAWLLSDGNLPARLALDLPFPLEFEKVGPAGPNLGLVTLNARRSARGSWEVYAEVRGSGGESREGALELRLNGAVLAREAVHTGPAGLSAHAVEIPGDEPVTVEARVTPLGFDSLASDNAATLELPALAPLRVWVEEGLPLFARAFEGRGTEATRLSGPAPALADLVITRAGVDTTAALRLHVNALPPELAPVLVMENQGQNVVDWQRNHPLLRHTTLKDLVFTNRARYQEGQGEAEVEKAGFEAIATGDQGPLLVVDTRGRAADVWLLFDPETSTLPYRVGFPVLMENLARMARQRLGTEEVSALRTGVLPDQAAPPGAELVLSGPQGSRRTARVDETGLVRGLPVPFAGEYTLTATGPARTLRPALLDAAETSLATVDKLDLGEVSVTASATLPSDRPLWTWFCLAGLAVLCLEWAWFNRRPGGARPRGSP